MKNFKLFALVALLGVSSTNGLFLTRESENTKVVSNSTLTLKKQAESKLEVLDNTAIMEEDGNYHSYILMENIKHEEENSIYGMKSIKFSAGDINASVEDIEVIADISYVSLVDTKKLDNGEFEVTLKGLKNTKSPLNLTISIKNHEEIEPLNIKVHVLDSYYNIQETTIVKPLEIENTYTQFSIKAYDNSNIAGIEPSELTASFVKNTNDEGKEILARTKLGENPFEFKYTTKNIGEAKIKLSFKRNFGSFTGHIAESIITVKVLDNKDYGTFYEPDNETGKFVKIDDTQPIKLSNNVLKTYYLGNGTSDFDPDDFEINKTTDMGAFKSIGVSSISLNGIPYLQIVLVTGDNATEASINIGFKKSNDYKTLKFDIEPNEYAVNVDIKKLNWPYYITEEINFYNVQNLVKATKNGEEIETIIEFSKIERKLGKQRIYVFLSSIEKVDCFDIYFTLNPKEVKDNVHLSAHNQALFFKDFLIRLESKLPAEYDTALEGYEDLKNEYKFLSEKAKNELINDLGFVKIYRRYIIENEFNHSFFDGITVRLDNTRYIVPTITLFVLLTLFGIILGCSLHTIYKKEKVKKPKKEKKSKKDKKNEQDVIEAEVKEDEK